MKMLFKERFFSWFDSYDIYDEEGGVLFTVKGELSWGHMLRIYDAQGRDIGMIKERIFTWLPKFELYKEESLLGTMCKEFTFFSQKYYVDYNGWQVDGDWLEWDYSITDSCGRPVAKISKEIWNWTDTYSIEVQNPLDALETLMVVLAIDAEKCSRDNS